MPRYGLLRFARNDGAALSPHLEKLLEQARRLGLTHRGIDLGDMMTGRRRKEPHAGIDRAALRIGGAGIEPPDPTQQDPPRHTRARPPADVEVPTDQSTAAG